MKTTSGCAKDLRDAGFAHAMYRRSFQDLGLAGAPTDARLKATETEAYRRGEQIAADIAQRTGVRTAARIVRL